MTRYTIPVGENGRIILPRELRRMLGVEKGSRVVIEAGGDRLELTTAERLRREARDRYRRLFPDRERNVVDEFIAEKHEEVRREGDAAPSDPSADKAKVQGSNDPGPGRDASE